MKTYLVEILPRAIKDIDKAYQWGQQQQRWTTAQMQQWHAGLWRAIFSLEQMPERCALAPENDDFNHEIRQLLYGSYRILFTIQDDVVKVLHVKHGSQDRM